VTELAAPAVSVEPTRSADRRTAPLRALRGAAPALLAFAAVRLLGFAALAAWAAAAGKSPHKLLAQRWDSIWYSRIAEHGYGFTLHLANGRVHSDLAFFPLLPSLERLVAALTPLSPADAGLAVSWAASLVAAWGIFAVGAEVRGRRTGVVLVVLWAALPTGIVQSMAYTESLFTALAAWALYAVLTGRWLWAAGFAVFAGLTRPVGMALAAAVWAAAAAAVLSSGGLRRAWRVHRRMLPAALLAPLGWLGYAAWVSVRTGSLTGYLDVQARWGNGFDGGRGLARFIGTQLTGPTPLAGIGLCAAGVLLAWLFTRCVRERQPLPLLVHTAVVVALALTGAGYFGSKPRLLMPAFPLLLPIAAALARWRPTRAALVLGGLALASAAYGAVWLNGSGPP
jgi:hypothetical protein